MSELSPEMPRRLPALLAAVGLLFSASLELVHYRAYVAPSASSFCTVGERLDCATVALSRWSVVLGVPLPIWGVAGFLALGLLAWFGSRWLLPLSGLAALASLGLLGVELFSIHSVCLLCEGVHLATFALFAVAYRDRDSLTETEGMLLVHVFTVPIGLLFSAHFLLMQYWAVFSWKGGITLPHAVDAEGHPWIGADEPKVELHEYTDYSCPHCAAATNIVRRLLAQHPSSLRVVHHNFPRMRCPVDAGQLTCVPARAANCAGEQAKYWEMDAWLTAHAPGQLKLDLHAACTEIGLDEEKLHTCMDSKAAYDRADGEALEAARRHVVEAPSYFIDGKKYVGGSVFVELEKRL